MLDVVDRGGERAFLGVNDALLNLACAQPGVAPNDADHRDVNRRENIRRRLDQDKRRNQQQKQRSYYKGIRSIKS